jgi:hypothetical protein
MRWGRRGATESGEPMGLRTRNKRPRAKKRAIGAWERDLGLAPGENCAESYVAYFEAGEIEGPLAEAFGLRERGELVNAVFTDRGRLVLRMPTRVAEPIAFDSKKPAEVAVLGPTERRLTGSRGGAERTQLVEVKARGGATVRIIIPESGVDALVRWGAERRGEEHRERISA